MILSRQDYTQNPIKLLVKLWNFKNKWDIYYTRGHNIWKKYLEKIETLDKKTTVEKVREI